MSGIKEIEASGFEALQLATSLLQRARLADPHAGLWEAADMQWWWRLESQSDDIAKVFWLDSDGPVAGVQLTSWTGESWQCDPLVIAGVQAPAPEHVWSKAIELASRHAGNGFDVPVGDDDETFRELAIGAGFSANSRDSTAWLSAGAEPIQVPVPPGFELVSRSQRPAGPHPLTARNGRAVERRLNECSLYDPELDLAIITADGQVAGYSLYWFDPVTKVGLVEPVRVEDGFQRRGLARAMLSGGIQRLLDRGAERVKVSYQTEAAGALYQSVGFRRMSGTTWFRAQSVG